MNQTSVAPRPHNAQQAQSIRRGTVRLLRTLGFSAAAEISLGSGRRTDLIAIGPTGEILIIEIKSSVADFQSDEKWIEYRSHCDRLLFAVSPIFPKYLIPNDLGLIVADEYGGAILREGESRSMPPATRKALYIKIARTVSSRLSMIYDSHICELS